MNLSLYFLIMCVLLFFVPMAMAHISLTYPPARDPPLDYLKISRTPFPCGVPRRSDAKYTTFYTNMPYNMTFRVAYPHQGGYRLSLWDANDNLIQGIWPDEYEYGFAGFTDQTTQKCDHVVFTKPCQNCIVRAERQASELGEIFQSCADVNIVDGQPQSTREKCSNAGEFVDDVCRCDRLRSGPVCQYKDHCTNDDDCLNGGQCVEESHSLVRKTCFCAFGYFGINCELSDEHYIMPGNSTAECFNRIYPDNQEQFDKHGLFKENCYQMNQLNGNDAIYYRTLGEEIEIILDYRSNTWIGIGWRPIDIDGSCRFFPIGPDSSSKTNETGLNSNARFQTVIDISSIPLHPMNCLDVVIGAVLDGRSRIADHYTRDQSTPLLDKWYDGSDSLTAAYGIQRDGRTVIMFSRSIKASEEADHSLGPGEKFVVWAKGQEIGHYFHSPKSALEASPVEDPIFYKPNVLKYHGKRNRGIHPIEFVKANSVAFNSGISRIHFFSFVVLSMIIVSEYIYNSHISLSSSMFIFLLCV